jgi:hypothetical protein
VFMVSFIVQPSELRSRRCFGEGGETEEQSRWFRGIDPIGLRTRGASLLRRLRKRW